jgi:hypothetical protein
MQFILREAWHIQFLEADLKTSLPCKLTFADPGKIIEMAERGGALKDLAARQAIDYGIELGRGSVFLFLTEEQYLSLLTPASCQPRS